MRWARCQIARQIVSPALHRGIDLSRLNTAYPSAIHDDNGIGFPDAFTASGSDRDQSVQTLCVKDGRHFAVVRGDDPVDGGVHRDVVTG
jgi:hypothetical protein